MAYHIETVRNNGYRCCCRRTWEDSYWEDEKVDALGYLEPTHKSGDCELEEVNITDGATGEVIGEGRLIYGYMGGGRGSNYSAQVWRGHIDDVPFEEIKGGRLGESWSELTNRLQMEAKEKALEKAKEAVLNAQKELEALR